MKALGVHMYHVLKQKEQHKIIKSKIDIVSKAFISATTSTLKLYYYYDIYFTKIFFYNSSIINKTDKINNKLKVNYESPILEIGLAS